MKVVHKPGTACSDQTSLNQVVSLFQSRPAGVFQEDEIGFGMISVKNLLVFSMEKRQSQEMSEKQIMMQTGI